MQTTRPPILTYQDRNGHAGATHTRHVPSGRRHSQAILVHMSVKNMFSVVQRSIYLYKTFLKEELPEFLKKVIQKMYLDSIFNTYSLKLSKFFVDPLNEQITLYYNQIYFK